MHVSAHQVLLSFIALSKALPREESYENLTIIDPRILAQQTLCSPGATECVGHCCVGDSCCSYGAVPCCLQGAYCQVFDQAPLCCVQGVNCGTNSTPPTSQTTSFSATSTSLSTTSTSETGVPSTTSAPSSTAQPTSSSTTTGGDGAVTTSASSGLAISDKIALGVGLAVGIPSALSAFVQMWRWSSHKS